VSAPGLDPSAPPLPLPPLSDLHRHLDGSLRASTLVELADALAVAVPSDLAFYQGMGLEAALARFRVTLSVLQAPEAVRRVAAEICEDAAAEGVTTLEIRFGPQLHGGAPLEEIVDAASDGVAGRAGLVLCGLYGEAPDVLERLVDVATRRPAVVGLDLAGGPSTGDAWRLEDYAPAFSRARDLGLGRTVHAGEGRPPGEIRRAIELLHAQRIGHGTSLLDEAAVLDLVRERGVTIEACPTSNMQVGVIATVAEHPIAKWLAAGVKVCVNTDNTLLSGLDAPAEYRNVAAIPGMNAAAVGATAAFGHAAAFRR
jgi:adenosine deaminase